ncbi:hypothetical protein [Deinococcus cellulosilyticus]|uniref:Uncharacterized protein n=1 Tax=Deinococcus cellulosilyticus (strain DSM 18568 / NBRC 106333 / KACC 11606 / 5516J-15) TaxID=1223518 RepID=A0A511MZE4_DEIC1|nr:hypothetical protein [Deinococcus cellulosilyticus]GEM45912.1 hypothetical protein DC3_15470 [Deinococcus cellulosilyticus NBRC 106333 = KACC 11606]
MTVTTPSEKTQKAMALTFEVPVVTGGNVTIRRMGLGEMNHLAAEWFEFIQAFAERFLDPAAPPGTGGLEIGERIIELSLVRPEDANRITAADLEPLLAKIWEVNNMASLVNFMLGRYKELLKAWEKAIQAQTVPTQTQKQP